MYAQAEIGEDFPRPGRGLRGGVRPAKLARRLIIALIVGALAGAAVMLQVKGWGTLSGEAGGACGSSGNGGVSYGACPRGITPALILSFVIGLPSVPAAIALLVSKGWARRAILVIGLAGGVLAGQSLFAIWHGTDLPAAWTAPFDATDQLTTVGAWTTGGSLVRVRVDEAVSYDAATGRQRWTLSVPGTDVACSVSGLGGGTGAGTGVGLIGYGADSTTCDHVMAVDLATGRQLWAQPVSNPYGGNEATGVLAVAGGTALVLTDEGIAGVSARSGTQQWTAPPPSGCSYQQLAGSGSSAVALAACGGGSYYVVSINPATGKPAWQHHVTEPSDSYQSRILSASPVLISDVLVGPRGSSSVRVFGAGGTMTADFRVDGITVDGGPVALNMQPTDGFGVPDVVAGGMLVGATEVTGGQSAIAGFRLSDGQRQWVVTTPDEVRDIAVSGSSVVLVDQSDPAYSLETVDLASGKLTSLGYFAQALLESDDSGLYAAGGSYLIANQHGDSNNGNPPVAAIRPPAKKG